MTLPGVGAFSAIFLGPQSLVLAACAAILWLRFYKARRASGGRMATGEVCDPQEGDKAPEEDFKQVEDFLAFAEEPLDFAIVRGWRTLARAFPDAASLHAFATTHRAKLTLYVWLFNFITYMASPTAKFRVRRRCVEHGPGGGQRR
jgi:hypothetical protein